MSRLLEIAQVGNPILKQKATEVEVVGDATIQSLIDDMLATLGEVGGWGLAAPQVNETLRILIIACHPTPRNPEAPSLAPIVLINPRIVNLSTHVSRDWERCLSVPGIAGLVPRYDSLTVRYITRRGAREEKDCKGVLARIVQHEYDHLVGILYLDRLESFQNIISQKELEKLTAKQR